jgi:hypothetical protein
MRFAFDGGIPDLRLRAQLHRRHSSAQFSGNASCLIVAVVLRTLFALSLVAGVAMGCSDGDDEATTCAEQDPPFSCAPHGCGGDVLGSATCVDGGWVCPENWIRTDTCPDDTCFHAPVYSCCDAAGNRTSPTCPGQGGEVCGKGGALVLNFGGGCPKPGEFTCDHNAFCQVDTQICVKHPTSALCEPIPEECVSDLRCECLKASFNCFQCEDSGDGEIVVTC